jgi:hypothetical protein
MRHNPGAGAVVIMLRSVKMHGSAQAVGELTEQGSPAFEAALPILSQLLKAESADREVGSTAYQLKAARFPNYLMSRPSRFRIWPFRIIAKASKPAKVLRAVRKQPKPSPGRTRRLMRRWSCSTTLLRYLHCRMRVRRQSSPSLFMSTTALG